MWIIYVIAYIIVGVIMGFITLWFQDNVLDDPIPDWERGGPIFVCAIAWPAMLATLVIYAMVKIVHCLSESIIDKFEGG